MVLSFTICVVAIALELGTVLLLFRNSLWREYPFFLVYAVWLLTANSGLFITDLYFRPIYPAVYWNIDSIDIFLRLLVVWEVFRQTFPKNSGLYRSLSKGLGIIALALLIFACASFWDYQNYTSLRSIHLALDRSFGFVQAIMILGTLVMARYYGLRGGRNIRGIALAFGAWVSVSTANNAMADLTSSFLPYFYRLRPLSFVFMLIVWIWALWVYEPNPPIEESADEDLSRWTEDWNRTISAARTMIRP
jgi:Na+-transporting NADH:ubiquinone oxidoreductase subunit NqrE